jgi:hypothetical protein
MEADSSRINEAFVERLVRDVIAGHTVPIDVVLVRKEASRWLVILRDMSHRILTVDMADTLTGAQLRDEFKARLAAWE